VSDLCTCVYVLRRAHSTDHTVHSHTGDEQSVEGR